MTVWILHCLIPLLVLAYFFGGPVVITARGVPVILLLLVGTLALMGHWMTALLALAGSIGVCMLHAAFLLFCVQVVEGSWPWREGRGNAE